MARIFNVSRQLVTVVFIFVLSACGGGGGGGGGSSTNTGGGGNGGNGGTPVTPDAANSYLPTSPNIAWTYNGEVHTAFAQDVVSNGVHVHSLVYPTGGKEHFVTAADQVSLQGLYLPAIAVGDGINYTGDIRFNNPMALFRTDWFAGYSYAVNGAGSINIAPTYGNRSIDHSGFITYVGDETISTTLGSFTAKRININITLTANVQGTIFTIPYNVTFWLAKGVGIVKREQGATGYLLTAVTGIDISGSVTTGGNAPTHLLVQQSALSASASFGSYEASTTNRLIDIVSADAHWQVATSASWIFPYKTSGFGSDSIVVSLATQELDIGSHQGSITVTNTDTLEQTVIPVTATVTLPVWTPSVSALSFDASYGWTEVYPQDLTADLNVYGVSYSLSSSVSFPMSNAITSVNSGVPGNLNGPLTVSVDRANLSGGTHTGQLNLSTTINGRTISNAVPITVKASEHILYAMHDGIGLASFPTVNKLAQTVAVLDSYGLTTTPWTATSDQSWLTVTPNGFAGQGLSVTANPAGLGTDTLHYANVTIASSNSHIEGTAHIRVALWVGSSDPMASAAIVSNYESIVADPIRPYLYAASASGAIDIYNLYSRTLIGTMASVGTTLREMKTSSDGSYLFVHDNTSKTIVRIDLDQTQTRVSLPFFDNTTVGGSSSSGGVTYAYARPAGHPVLILDSGATIDAQSGHVFPSEFPPMFYHTGAMAASADGRRFCQVDGGLSLYSIRCYRINYSSLDGGDVRYNFIAQPQPVGSDGWDIAMSDDASVVYVVGAGQNGLSAYSVSSSSAQFTNNLPGWTTFNGFPIAMDMTIDGTIVFGTANTLATTDLWVYNSDGSIRKTVHVAGNGNRILPAQVTASADGLMVMAMTNDPKIAFIRSN